MKKIIFDMDGALFQTEPVLLAALETVESELGMPSVPKGKLNRHVGEPTDELIRNLFPPETDRKACRHRFTEAVQQAALAEGELFPDVREMLGQLSEMGYEMYAASYAGIRYVTAVLEKTGIASFFAGSYCTAVPREKRALIKKFSEPGEFACIVGGTRLFYEITEPCRIPFLAASYGYICKKDYSKAVGIAALPQEVTAGIIRTEVFYTLTEELIRKRNSRVIGINSADTWGEPLFTERFSDYLKSEGFKTITIHLSDYPNPTELCHQGTDELEGYYFNSINYWKLIREVLDPLRDNGFIRTTVACLDLETDTYTNYRRYTADRDTIVLIEGILLFRAPILEYLDSRIFLDIDLTESLHRGLDREQQKFDLETLEKYTKLRIPLQKRYLTEHSPAENSNAVIDNSDADRPKITRLQ